VVDGGYGELAAEESELLRALEADEEDDGMDSASSEDGLERREDADESEVVDEDTGELDMLSFVADGRGWPLSTGAASGRHGALTTALVGGSCALDSARIGSGSVGWTEVAATPSRTGWVGRGWLENGVMPRLGRLTKRWRRRR